jgi:hypothetical protein
MEQEHNREFPIVEFPLRGLWKAIRSPGHHRYAYDFAALKHEESGLFSVSTLRACLGDASAEHSYSWGAPVFAPVDGSVAVACDGWPDNLRLSVLKDFITVFARGVFRPVRKEDLRPFAGNHIVIASRAGYVLLAHLRRGSLKVTSQQHVECGQQIAAVGNSGNTVAPHLHFQINTGPDLLGSPIVKFGFASYERLTESGWVRANDIPPHKGWLLRCDPK